MGSQWSLNQKSFELLLQWLSPDRDLAAQRYETLRRRLVFLFECHGADDPASLVDAVFDRACRRLEEGTIDLTKDAAAFLHGVARHVSREDEKKRAASKRLALHLLTDPVSIGDRERRLTCLQRCVALLDAAERHLLERYYDAASGAGRIKARSKLADECGLTHGALRIKVMRIRNGLEECIRGCLGNEPRNESDGKVNPE